MASSLRARLSQRWAPARHAAGIILYERYSNPFLVKAEPDPDEPYFAPLAAAHARAHPSPPLPPPPKRASARAMKRAGWAMSYKTDKNGRLI